MYRKMDAVREFVPIGAMLAKEDDGVLNEFRFSRDEQWLAIAGRNLTVRPLAQFDKPRTLRGDGRNYGSAQFSPVADTILTIDGKGAIEILDAKSGRASSAPGTCLGCGTPALARLSQDCRGSGNS